MTGTSSFDRRAVDSSEKDGFTPRTTFLATVVADAISSIDPGTSAHSTPAEPISPTNQEGNASLATDSSARSVPSAGRFGTLSTAAKPTKNTNAISNWYRGMNIALRLKTFSSRALSADPNVCGHM